MGEHSHFTMVKTSFTIRFPIKTFLFISTRIFIDHVRFHHVIKPDNKNLKTFSFHFETQNRTIYKFILICSQFSHTLLI